MALSMLKELELCLVLNSVSQIHDLFHVFVSDSHRVERKRSTSLCIVASSMYVRSVPMLITDKTGVIFTWVLDKKVFTQIKKINSRAFQRKETSTKTEVDLRESTSAARWRESSTKRLTYARCQSFSQLATEAHHYDFSAPKSRSLSMAHGEHPRPAT